VAIVRTRRIIDNAGADAVLAAAEQAASAEGHRVVIAVVDPWGELIALRRTPGAQVASSRVAVDKARTAAIFVRPSREMEEQVTAGRLGALALHGASCLTGGIPLTVDGEVVGAIDEPGLLVYLGVTHDDGPTEVAWTARKIWDLRLLRDEQSASDVGAPVLVVSQFTLYGDARKGRRPTWQAAAPGPVSEPLYDAVCTELERLGAHVERGRFGADMRVEAVNDGPITLVLDSP
jgi:D-tyrosyl-tRNA(Tyr) deacylase